MVATGLTPQQYANLLLLMLLREQGQTDPVAACAAFGITRAQLDAILPKLSAEQLLPAVASSGNELFFHARPNLGTLLQSPAPLVGVLLAAQASAQSVQASRISACS